jgi:protein-S-isoprenylcysteine O-methyltransferase Ste14
MKTKQKIAVAISGVSLGITVFVFLFVLGTQMMGIADLRQLLSFMPAWIQLWVGAMNVAVFLPVFLFGISALKPRGAVGDSSRLITNGIYHYIRNPIYAGVSFTIFGLGLILGHTGVVLAGLAWLLLCYVQSKREEELKAKYNKGYDRYKKQTPLFVPEFQILFRDLIHSVTASR